MLTKTNSKASRQDYNYRDFQQIWNPIDGQRTREACARCREKRSKCDGKQPCRRCRRSHWECVYNQQHSQKLAAVHKEQPEEFYEVSDELLLELATVKRTLEKLGMEIVQLTEQGVGAPREPVPLECPNSLSDNDNKDSKDERVGDQTSSDVAVRGHTRTELNKTWNITLSKKGFRVDIHNVRQLYELLAHIADPTVFFHTPTTETRPVGTRAMTVRSTVRWPKLYRTHALEFDKHISKFPPADPLFNTSTLVISTEKEEFFLDLIILATTQCSPSSRKKFSERVLIQKCSQQPPSPTYRALRYAIGATSAEHVLTTHFSIDTLDLPANFNGRDYGRELATKYFTKAHDLLIDQVLESNSEDFCNDTVDALTVMIEYLISEGQDKLASTYLGMAIRVAAELNYHKSLRDLTETFIEVSELEAAIKWNHLMCIDQAFASLSNLPTHAVHHNDMRLNLQGTTIRVPSHMSSDKLQRLHESLYQARSSAICRDYLDAWRETTPTAQDLEGFVSAFARWVADLPPDLRVPSPETPYNTAASFVLALDLQIHHHVALIGLYYPFLPHVHRDLAALPAELPRQAERACSDATTMASRLALSYVHASGCMFPINVFPVACNAHMQLAKSEDKAIRERNRAYVARAAKILKGTREYELKQHYFLEHAQLLEDFMASEGIDTDADTELGPEDGFFTPVKVLGVGW